MSKSVYLSWSWSFQIYSKYFILGLNKNFHIWTDPWYGSPTYVTVDRAGRFWQLINTVYKYNTSGKFGCNIWEAEGLVCVEADSFWLNQLSSVVGPALFFWYVISFWFFFYQWTCFLCLAQRSIAATYILNCSSY